jgi:hypothetical protein
MSEDRYTITQFLAVLLLGSIGYFAWDHVEWWLMHHREGVRSLGVAFLPWFSELTSTVLMWSVVVTVSLACTIPWIVASFNRGGDTFRSQMVLLVVSPISLVGFGFLFVFGTLAMAFASAIVVGVFQSFVNILQPKNS